MAKMLSIVYIIRMTLIVEAFISQTINKTLELNAAQRTTGPVTTLPISTRRPTDDIKSPIDSDLASIAPMLCGIERKHFLSKIHVILKGDRKDNADIFRYAAKQVVKNLCKKSRKAKKKDLHCVLRKLYDTDGDGVIDDEERMQFTQTSVYTKGSEYQLEGCDLIKKSKAKRNRRRIRRQRHRGH